MTKEQLIAKDFAKNIIPVTWKGICNNNSQLAGEDYYEYSSEQMLEVDSQANAPSIGEAYTKNYCVGMNNCYGRSEHNCMQALVKAIETHDDGEEINWKELKEACHEVCINSRCDCIVYLDYASRAASDPTYRIVEEYYVNMKKDEEITPKQKQFIEGLMKQGAPKFIGKTKKHASAYINQYKSLLNAGVTPKQLKYISNIIKYGNGKAPQFTGTTKKEASSYIEANRHFLDEAAKNFK